VKFTIVSHACMYVEHEGTSVLIDPWIVGSCYWRSWWNFPEPSQELVDSLRPDFIYLTHLHWDHFHGPSLRRFPRTTKILIPKTLGSRFRDDLEWLGFTDIVEIPHAGRASLAPGFDLHSFQFGHPTDSAVVITDGKTVLFNVNDTKLFGAPLAQIKRQFKSFDFVFKSHSSASPIPYCIEGYEGRFSELLSRQDYIEEFASFGLHVGARYAVPFASNHCFLHRDTIRFNDTAVNPEDVRDHYNARAEAMGHPSRARVMPPGSSWDDKTGFDIRPFDYTKRADYIAQLQAKYRDKLEAQYALEAEARVEVPAVTAYFTAFFEALPGALARSIGGRIVLRAGEQTPTDVVLDFAKRRVVVGEHVLPDDIVIEVPPLVLNDLVTKRMFSAWTPSKRLRIHLPGTSLRPLLTFLTVIDYYETGYLPLRSLLSLRFVAWSGRRARELVAIGEATARYLYTRHVARVPLKPKMFFRTPRGKRRTSDAQ
jgi:UDP-MurNAc hydroxylase